MFCASMSIMITIILPRTRMKIHRLMTQWQCIRCVFMSTAVINLRILYVRYLSRLLPFCYTCHIIIIIKNLLDFGSNDSSPTQEY
jgi:hypothetical protein